MAKILKNTKVKLGEKTLDNSAFNGLEFFLGLAKGLPNSNANNVTVNGNYIINQSSLNTPYSYGVLIHFNRDNFSAAQIAFDISQSRISVRSARNESGIKVWNQWKSM